MYFMLDTDTAEAVNLAAVIIPSLIGVIGVIFGGTGFWQWKQAKDEAKRLKKEKEDTDNNKIDNLTNNMTSLMDTVGSLSSDVKDIKEDIMILQKANEETAKYREQRDRQDKLDSMERKAIIESLCGMMRERLLDNYKKCIKKGYYTREEREIYSAMFECYEKEPFNGDGVMHDLRAVMRDLPWTAEDAGVIKDSDSED